MKNVVIVDALRTAQGKLGGKLKSFTNQQLGEIVVRALLGRSKMDSREINEVIFGCVLQQSDAANVARVISLLAGIPHEVTAFTVSRNCASGLQAVVSAFQMIQNNEADVVVAGGVECMSAAPFLNRDMRYGKKLRHSVMVDSILEGLTDPVCRLMMGETAEHLASEFKISRKEQDAYAALSHAKASQAMCAGKFKEEIVEVYLPAPSGKCGVGEIFKDDESVNGELTEEIFAQYPPVFREGGSVTAGNSCPISDGAAALLLMSETKARTLGIKPLGMIRSYAFAGVEPKQMGLGPVQAVPLALKRARATLQDVSLIELNEAFASQVLACERLLKLDRSLMNVSGGGIALGHPVGATGARILVTLLHEMERRKAGLGLAALCVGGGQGGAMVIEKNQ